jgi:ribose 5-phosphate isomerase B
MRIAFASDHAGLTLRHRLAEVASELGHTVTELGALTGDAYDYPDAADAVVAQIRCRRADLGVLVCGTGIGMSIRANRHRGVRAAMCCSVETASLARRHNHANVLCLGERTQDPGEAEAILHAFLEAKPDPEPRHRRRVYKLDF